MPRCAGASAEAYDVRVHDDESTRRRWREQHANGTAGSYGAFLADERREEERREREEAERREAARQASLTPEQRRAEWKDAQDDGYLTEEERAALSVGVAPSPFTPRRLLRVAAPLSGLGLIAIAMFAIVGGDTPLLGWPIGVGGAGLALFILGVVLEEKGRRRKRGRSG